MADMLSEGVLEQKSSKKNYTDMGLVNPVIRKMQRAGEQASSEEGVATYGGIAIKTAFFLIVTLVAIGGYFALQPMLERSGTIIESTSGIIAIKTTTIGMLWLVGAVLLTIIMPLICWLCRSIIPVIGTVYCIAQGYLVGFIADSLVPEFKWLAILALILTIGLGIRYRGSDPLHAITSNKEITAEINRLIRENIVGTKQETQLLLDGDIRQQLFRLYEKLPRDGNRNLWNYKSPAAAHLRSEIDAISKAYIEKYHPADYARLMKTLEEQAEVYRMTYGIHAGSTIKGQRNHANGNSYVQNKIDDLYYRLGNAILRELKDYDRTMEIQQRAALVAARKEEYRRNSACINKLRRDRNIEAATGTARMQMSGAGRDFDKAWMQMKKALERECREWKEKDVEIRSNSNRENQME